MSSECPRLVVVEDSGSGAWHIVAMSVEPLRTVRDHLSDFVDRAEREHASSEENVTRLRERLGQPDEAP